MADTGTYTGAMKTRIITSSKGTTGPHTAQKPTHGRANKGSGALPPDVRRKAARNRVKELKLKRAGIKGAHVEPPDPSKFKTRPA